LEGTVLMKELNSIAIITARGGSKRIPRKNIKNFLGRPIIQYSIEAALKSGCFDEVMVSTDDQEIAEISKKLGAKVPFLRSAENANDHADTASVIREVLLKYRETGVDFTYCCCIYPTAPFITADKLRNARSIMHEKSPDCVLPVTSFSYTIWRGLKIEAGKVKMIWPENYHARSQDLPPAYHDCGQFYFMKSESLLEQMVLFPKFTIPMEFPESEVQDIDNEEDWKIAEIKYKFMTEKKA
jgi:pseudaminic acid cytidylyltransferase